MNTDKILFERALTIIMNEFGLDEEHAMKWLNDDTYDWFTGYKNESAHEAFIDKATKK